VSPDQCRAARELLRWTRRELADAATVPLWVIAAFEDGRDILPHYEIEICEALEAVGIEFLAEVESDQFKPAGMTYSPIRKETLAPLSIVNGANLVWVVFQQHPARRRN
jgi:hypothetical protein